MSEFVKILKRGLKWGIAAECVAAGAAYMFYRKFTQDPGKSSCLNHCCCCYISQHSAYCIGQNSRNNCKRSIPKYMIRWLVLEMHIWKWYQKDGETKFWIVQLHRNEYAWFFFLVELVLLNKCRNVCRVSKLSRGFIYTLSRDPRASISFPLSTSVPVQFITGWPISMTIGFPTSIMLPYHSKALRIHSCLCLFWFYDE